MINEKKLIEVLEEKAERLLASVPLTFTEKDIAIGIKSAIRIVKEQP